MLAAPTPSRSFGSECRYRRRRRIIGTSPNIPVAISTTVPGSGFVVTDATSGEVATVTPAPIADPAPDAVLIPGAVAPDGSVRELLPTPFPPAFGAPPFPDPLLSSSNSSPTPRRATPSDIRIRIPGGMMNGRLFALQAGHPSENAPRFVNDSPSRKPDPTGTNATLRLLCAHATTAQASPDQGLLLTVAIWPSPACDTRAAAAVLTART